MLIRDTRKLKKPIEKADDEDNKDTIWNMEQRTSEVNKITGVRQNENQRYYSGKLEGEGFWALKTLAGIGPNKLS
jgi:hypothetical protein